MRHVVVVGAGQAGLACVAKLRSSGFDGSITLIGEEGQPPYQRPPLSKAYLLGEMELERLYLRPLHFFAEKNINLLTDTCVEAIDVENSSVNVGEEHIKYDDLVLATGSSPRRLPAAIGGDLGKVYTVRGLSDVDAMKSEFRPGAHVLIVGGGYIGLEAAAVAAKLGLKVTLVEMADRILQRVAAPETSDYFRDLHERHGVKICEGIGLERLEGEGNVSRAVLSDGSVQDIDFAVVGVGIVPATSLAEAAGLDIENGIATDAYGRSSVANIWAAGDCASFPFAGARIRLESVPNAIDQAEAVAANIMGAEQEYIARPWFWSDQYDVKLQIAGLNTGYDRVVVRSGENSRSHWYFRGADLLAVDAANDPRAYMIAKRLIEAGKTADPDVIADSSADLRPLLKA